MRIASPQLIQLSFILIFYKLAHAICRYVFFMKLVSGLIPTIAFLLFTGGTGRIRIASP
jgi:hypothetical protein